MEAKSTAIGAGTATVVFSTIGFFLFKRDSKRKAKRAEIKRELEEIKKIMSEKHWMSKDFKEAVYRQQILIDKLAKL